MKTGELLMQGWRKNSLTFNEYVELAEKLTAEGRDGKSIALRQHTPIMEYIRLAYNKYFGLCYYMGVKPLTVGAWLRSDFTIE